MLVQSFRQLALGHIAIARTDAKRRDTERRERDRHGARRQTRNRPRRTKTCAGPSRLLQRRSRQTRCRASGHHLRQDRKAQRTSRSNPAMNHTRRPIRPSDRVDTKEHRHHGSGPPIPGNPARESRVARSPIASRFCSSDTSSNTATQPFCAASQKQHVQPRRRQPLVDWDHVTCSSCRSCPWNPMPPDEDSNHGVLDCRRCSHRSNEAWLSVDFLPRIKPSIPISSSKSGQ